MTGFTSIAFTASKSSVQSLFGVGVSGGDELEFSCPDGAMVTGFSSGASKPYPQGWITNLQFLCQNPFTDASKVAQLRGLSAPRVNTLLACSTHTIRATDQLSWWALADLLNTNPMELMRANPNIAAGALQVGHVLFVPPCYGGGQYFWGW